MGVAWRGSLTTFSRIQSSSFHCSRRDILHTLLLVYLLLHPIHHRKPKGPGVISTFTTNPKRFHFFWARTPPRDFLTGVLLGLSTLGSLISCEAKSTGGAEFVSCKYTYRLLVLGS